MIQGFLILLSLLLLVALLAVTMLPAVVQALPGELRVRLPEDLLRAVTTPLPTALPPPALAPESIQLTAETIGLVIAPPPAATVTAVEAELLVTAVPSLPPTVEPEPSPTSKPSATSSPLPNAVRLEGMKVEPQKLNNCGPTNLSMNLNYYGLETTQFDVAAVVKPHYDDRNVSPQELVSYTNELASIRASQFSGGGLTLLKELLVAGFPVVIEKGYEPDDWQGWMGHYVTLTGYDDGAASFVTMDTFLGPWDSSGRLVTYAEVEEKWEHFNNTFFVLYEPRQEVRFWRIIGPELSDPETMWQEAAAQAQQRIDVNSQNAFAWFNLGSSYTQLGELTGDGRFYTAAVSAFDQARLIGLPTRMLWYQFQPYVAYLASSRIDDVLTLTAAILEDSGGRDVEETYFYRGQALEAVGDVQGAAAAYSQALALKPGYGNAQNALDGLTRAASTGRNEAQAP